MERVHGARLRDALYGCMPLSIGKAQLHHTFVQLSLYAAHPCMAVQL